MNRSNSAAKCSASRAAAVSSSESGSAGVPSSGTRPSDGQVRVRNSEGRNVFPSGACRSPDRARETLRRAAAGRSGGAGRARPALAPGGGDLAPDPSAADFHIEFRDQLLQLLGVLASCSAWSRQAWVSARFTVRHSWSSVARSGSDQARPRDASPPGIAPPASSWPARHTGGRPRPGSPHGTTLGQPGRSQFGAAPLPRPHAPAV